LFKAELAVQVFAEVRLEFRPCEANSSLNSRASSRCPFSFSATMSVSAMYRP
jgi:hypothetical protein